MRIVSVPFTLNLARTVFLLSAPWAAAEVLIASRAPWWRLPYSGMASWAGVALVVTGGLGAAMVRGRRWAWNASVAVATIWTLLSGWLAIRTRLPSLGYFTIFLAIFLIYTLLWLRHEMGRSYLDPRVRWYHGLPRPIPGLVCELAPPKEGPAVRFQVARVDREGAIVFSGKREGAMDQVLRAAVTARGAELVFRYRTDELRCPARPTLLFERGTGAGFCFKDLGPDARKNLGDFIETLRGEGYVE
ncbi:MAG: hypothetical protein NDJ90_03485 [Oligoflexia bacterium]|nr:hypothetical protein [Oligoflexia bacterium]